MAKLELKGMADYLRELQAVSNATSGVCKAVVYAGADVVADAIRAETEALSTVSDVEALAAARKGTPTKISESQKAALLESLGTTPITKGRTGRTQTSVGFGGYNNIKTKRWPNGQPNNLIARSCNKGSSAMLRQPFVDRALKKCTSQAVSAMQDEMEKQIEKAKGGK